MPFRKTITFGSVCAFIFSLFNLSYSFYFTLYAFSRVNNFYLNPWWVHLLIITILLTFWILGLQFYQTFCYLILYDDKMVIKNIFFTFYSKEIYFSDIENKKIVRIFTHNNAVQSPYSTRMIALYKKGKKWPETFSYWYLRLVDKIALAEIASFLREKGIDVVVSNKTSINSSILDKSGID